MDKFTNRNEWFGYVMDEIKHLLIQHSNVTSYRVMGYSYLDMQLVLYWADARWLYTWKYLNKHPELKITELTHEDFLNDVKQFEDNWNEVVEK